MPDRRPHNPGSPLSATHVEKLREWAKLWAVPGLEERVQIKFSKRMFRTLGRYLPGRHEIRLAAFLTEPGWEELFAEVLCHEAAHAACYERIGWDGRPHGKEWKTLMSTAGYEPRVRLPQSPALRDVARKRQAQRQVQNRKAPKAWTRFRRLFTPASSTER